MRSHDKQRYTTAGGTALALALSGLLFAGCSSDPEAPAAAPAAAPSPSPSQSPSASRSPTVSASPTPSPTAAAPTPAETAPAPAPAPAPLTAEDAQRIIADYHQNNADLGYTVFDNGDGTFDVKVTSRSIAAQGGTGTAGIYTVEQGGRFALK